MWFLEDKDGDGIPDGLQMPFRAIFRSLSDNSRFTTDRLSIRGRKELINASVNSREIPQTQQQESDEEIMNENGEDIVLKDGLFAYQDYKEIKSKCLAADQLFTDTMFPPQHSSLFNKEQTSPSDIEWKRASELVKNPCFFVDGQSRFDINQGSLGDCWLSAAVACLTMQTELFEKVVPHDQSFCQAYAGIFHFRFWQFGEWIDVVVDDYLPTKNGQLIYMRSDDPNEFWSALLEKAYAKLYGSYESLVGGQTTEAMVDFSGGCAEHFRLNEDTLRGNPELVKTLLLKARSKNSMMAASIESRRAIKEEKLANGLIQGHAFSITDVLSLRTKDNDDVFLVRLRNPWGNKEEWNGAWSDESIEWEMIDKTDINELRFRDDGEFFMSINDLVKWFDTLDICNLTPESIEGNDLNIVWQQDHYHGSWIKGESAGGCRNYLDTFVTNPQFNFELMDANNDGKCTFIVALMQKGRRKGKVVGSDCQNGCLTIGFTVYEIDQEVELPLKDYFGDHLSKGNVTFINCREVVARFDFNYKSGKKYVVVPSTFEPGEEGDFLLRIFSEKKLKK